MSDIPVPSEDIPIDGVDSPSVVLEFIYQLKIRDVKTGLVVTAKKTDTMRHVQNLMRDNRVSGVPVIDGENLLGIVTIENIIMALDKGHIENVVEEHMTKNLIVLEDDMPLSFAITYLNRFRYGRFPVVNKEKQLVGILSSKDVIRSLLVAMNNEVLRLEKIHQKGARPPSTHVEMSFTTIRHDFELAGKASTEIKKALKSRNIDPKIIRRIAIACYELEINQVVHSMGGTINCFIQPDKVSIVAADNGPGIEDISLVLQEGWSTADEWIRSLGFGAGMGLPNTKRVSDEFYIESTPGTGTTVRSIVNIASTQEEKK
jgi:CBS domain-containing protein/anti-sigma regulatory factor (Ser/Thr protein kinase)